MTEAERVYQKLKRDILLGDIEAGTWLSETVLCERYDTGRTPVREACRRLQDRSLLDAHPFRGCMVPGLTVTEYQSLSEAARLIEPFTASLAAQRANPKQMERIERLAEYEYRPGNKSSYLTFLDRNYDLHVEIASAARNPILEQTVINLQDRLMRYFYHVISIDSYAGQLLNEHLALAKAIRSRNREAAEQKAREHQEHTFERTKNAILNALGLDGMYSDAAKGPRTYAPRVRRTKE